MVEAALVMLMRTDQDAGLVTFTKRQTCQLFSGYF